MSRTYTAVLDAITVTNDSDQDIWCLVNSANISIRLTEMELWSSLGSSEMVNLRFVRRSSAGSAGGTAITPKALDEANTIASKITSFTPLVTTPGTIGDKLRCYQWSQYAPLIWLPTPEMQIEIKPSGILGLHLGTAVAASRTWSGHVSWTEAG